MRKNKDKSNEQHGEMDSVLTTTESGGMTAAHSNSPTPTIPPVMEQGQPAISPPNDAVDDTDIDAELDSIAPPAMTRKMRRLMDMAIVTELVGGTAVEVIAKNYKLDVRYVVRVRQEWIKACKLQETIDYKHELKVLGIEAIREGLQKGDVHKRMNGAIRVMAGIGEFKPDVININVLQRLENVPPELRDRFITSTAEEEAIDVEGVVVNE